MSDEVQGLCCDTTAVNTGIHIGAAVLIEEGLNRNLLKFLCRHHMFELVLGAVFFNLVGTSNDPDCPYFAGFKSAWTKLDLREYFACVPFPLKQKSYKTFSF